MNNPWTPERVKRLTELWLSGCTRAQVAADLGPPITESAVKGKVRRLGLKRDGAAAPKRDAAGPRPKRRVATPAADAGGRKRAPSRADDGPARPAAASSAEDSAAANAQASAPEDAAGEVARRGDGLPEQPPASAAEDHSPADGDAAAAASASAADGSAERAEPRPFRFPGYNECHWPHGEPDNPDFGFCLAPAAPGKSYCDEHAEQAYRKKGS